MGGFSRLAGLGEWLPPGTLWMVLRRWSNFHWFPMACGVPLSLQGSSPSTPGPVFGHVAERARSVEKKNIMDFINEAHGHQAIEVNYPRRLHVNSNSVQF